MYENERFAISDKYQIYRPHFVLYLSFLKGWIDKLN